MASTETQGTASTVFVTGATGVIGRRVVPALVEAGHAVVAVVRTDAGARQVAAAGARSIAVDLFDGRAVQAATTGCDAIVHLATNVPPMTRMGMRYAWVTHNRLRTEATHNLLDAARAHGVTRVVKESITFTYPDCGAEWIDEESPLNDANPTWAPTIAGDRMVVAFNDDGGAAVLLRFGSLYAPDARSTDEYLRLARVHVAPVPGRADAYVSSTHADDAATAVTAAVHASPGVYNVVDDEPFTRRAYADAFAAAFGLARLRLTSERVIASVGGSGGRALAASQRVSNARFRAEVAWTPAFRDARAGWAAVAAARRGRDGEGEAPT